MSEPDDRRKRLVLAVCCVSIVMVVLDISVVNAALPAVRREWGASVSALQWTVDAYTLVLAAFLLPAGAAADRWGRRRVFLLGLLVFGLGSALCALAPGVGALVGARAVQAVGGTMLNPVAMGIVATAFPRPAERARAIGVFGSMSGLALALGPVLGGALVDGWGWRAVFWVNLPVVAAGVAGALCWVPESRAERARRFDPVGQLLVVALLGGAVFALISAGRSGWSAPSVWGPLAGAAAAVPALGWYEARRADPLLEVRLLRRGPLAAALVAAFAALGAFAAFLFAVTLYLQGVRQMSALRAGLCLAPVGVLILVLSPRTGRAVGRYGPRGPLLVSGAALALAGALLLVAVGPRTPVWVLLAVFALVGVFQGTVNPPITNTAVSGMPGSMASLAAALASAARQTGSAVGVAVAGVLLSPGVAAEGAPGGGSGGAGFVAAARGVWWLLLAAGVLIAVLAAVGPGARRGAAAGAGAAVPAAGAGAAAVPTAVADGAGAGGGAGTGPEAGRQAQSGQSPR
ncbi:MFS transporter [Kitasatospora phosalacinea]|uniref:MFS transporter n=1 Tax=Kitasatospora phosalacinea TaxID=2065 RepID=A0A9W6V3E1_9ACTN|nr:MFS transporter [Kitasatospora phosalacinea]GLW73561.1 MFS transporter [Kitasatospora phosalacinea]